MKSENRVRALVEAMTKLGLPESLANELRLHLCFQPDHFLLKYCLEKGKDRISVEIYIRKEKSADEYVIPYYEAYLQKSVEIPLFQTGEISSSELEKKMSAIDWHTFTRKIDEMELKAIEEVVLGLNLLSTEPVGAKAAELLRWKYWSNTPFSIYCNSNRILKNDFEVSQRFYLFQNEEVINVEEAYRFLCHRWREKQFQSLIKQQTNKTNSISTKDGKERSIEDSTKKTGYRKIKNRQRG